MLPLVLSFAGSQQHPSPKRPGAGRSLHGGAWAGMPRAQLSPPLTAGWRRDQRAETRGIFSACWAPGEIDTLTFLPLFSPTEPLGAKASTENSDHLILNKVFLAGNWILYFPPNLVRGSYPHICWAEHWARLGGRGAEAWWPFSGTTRLFWGYWYRPTTGPSGKSRTLSFAGQSLCLGDFQATSWGECLGGG